jgi:hypothetical protein
LNEDDANKTKWNFQGEEAMTKKITKSGAISRRRLLATASAGAALAASLKSGRDAFSL